MLTRLWLLRCRIIGDGNKNLQHIVQVFVKVLSHGNELAEPETADHMVRLLSQMQGSLPPQVRIICSSSCMSFSSLVPQGAYSQGLFMSPPCANVAVVCCVLWLCFSFSHHKHALLTCQLIATSRAAALNILDPIFGLLQCLRPPIWHSCDLESQLQP